MKQTISLAYYREKDCTRFLDSIDYRESMHDTWEEWHQGFLKMKIDLIIRGFHVVDSVVDIDELNNYCKQNKIKNDGKARSRFVAKR